VLVEVTNADRIRSRSLGCFLRAVGEGDETRLRVGLGPQGEELFPTDAERAEAETARAESEAERAEAAEARVQAERALRLAAQAELAKLRALLPLAEPAVTPPLDGRRRGRGRAGR
jgi:multidrug efflux pump subunit AcrA (membrane-fusion protein)